MTENEDDIRAVICDFGLTITSQSRIGRAPQLEALNGFSLNKITIKKTFVNIIFF